MARNQKPDFEIRSLPTLARFYPRHVTLLAPATSLRYRLPARFPIVTCSTSGGRTRGDLSRCARVWRLYHDLPESVALVANVSLDDSQIDEIAFPSLNTITDRDERFRCARRGHESLHGENRGYESHRRGNRHP